MPLFLVPGISPPSFLRLKNLYNQLFKLSPIYLGHPVPTQRQTTMMVALLLDSTIQKRAAGDQRTQNPTLQDQPPELMTWLWPPNAPLLLPKMPMTPSLFSLRNEAVKKVMCNCNFRFDLLLFHFQLCMTYLLFGGLSVAR